MRGQVWLQIRELSKAAGEVIYHIVVVAISAWVALSLPHDANIAIQAFARYWPRVERNTVALVAIEITIAVLLMLGLNYLRRSMRDMKLAEVAKRAGLTNIFSPGSPLARRTMRKLKTHQGQTKHIMILGSTGYNTFVDPHGDLHAVIWKCLEAKVMLLNPYSEAAQARVNAILDPKVTHESVTRQVRRSIELCKQLKKGQKSIRLKLYSDPPHVKLAILGNAIWLQHYHTGLDVRRMPEYLFQQNQNDYGLYTLLYQYFSKRWESPEIPEYDLETDELVYRESNGNEKRRELFPMKADTPPTAFPAATTFRDTGLQDR